MGASRRANHNPRRIIVNINSIYFFINVARDKIPCYNCCAGLREKDSSRGFCSKQILGKPRAKRHWRQPVTIARSAWKLTDGGNEIASRGKRPVREALL